MSIENQIPHSSKSKESISISAAQNLQRNPRRKRIPLTTEPQKINIRGITYTNLDEGVYVRADMVRETGGKVRTPKDILPLLALERVAEQEILVVFTLDGNNQVIKKHQVTKGLVNQSQFHPREIYRVAIQDNAVSIMVAHNHPSGNLDPSEADLVATRRLVEVAKTIGIPVLDHIIVAASGFLSLRERFPAYFT